MNVRNISFVQLIWIVLGHAHNIIKPRTDQGPCTILPISLETWENFTSQISEMSQSTSLGENQPKKDAWKEFNLNDDDSNVLLPRGEESFQQYMMRMNLETQRNLAKLNAAVDRLSFAAANYDNGPKLRRRDLPDPAKEFRGSSLFPGTKLPVTYLPTDTESRPSDCSDLLVYGKTTSGVYEIYPFSCKCSKPVKVFCDMETDGGGWTVFLARNPTKKPINFTRNWKDYKNGFGSPDGEYWLGNEYLHRLTTTRKYHLRFEAEDGEERSVWGQYNNFVIDNESPNKYKATVTGFEAQSTMFDRLSYMNGVYFSTSDVDNDNDGKKHCAQVYKTSWWYKSCYYYLPTGSHGSKGDSGIVLNPWSKKDATKRYAVSLQMKIRPIICSTKISRATLNSHNCINRK